MNRNGTRVTCECLCKDFRLYCSYKDLSLAFTQSNVVLLWHSSTYGKWKKQGNVCRRKVHDHRRSRYQRVWLGYLSFSDSLPININGSMQVCVRIILGGDDTVPSTLMSWHGLFRPPRMPYVKQTGFNKTWWRTSLICIHISSVRWPCQRLRKQHRVRFEKPDYLKTLAITFDPNCVFVYQLLHLSWITKKQIQNQIRARASQPVPIREREIKYIIKFVRVWIF